MNDIDIREMIRENLSLTRENNKLLKKLIRKERWASLMRILYWLMLLGASLAIYYHLQPYIEDAISLYGNVEGRIDEISKILPDRSEVE